MTFCPSEFRVRAASNRLRSRQHTLGAVLFPAVSVSGGCFGYTTSPPEAASRFASSGVTQKFRFTEALSACTVMPSMLKHRAYTRNNASKGAFFDNIQITCRPYGHPRGDHVPTRGHRRPHAKAGQRLTQGCTCLCLIPRENYYSAK